MTRNVELEPGLDILAVAAGDLTVRWNSDDPADVEKAQDLVESLQRQGYSIMLQLEDGSYQRVDSFDRAADAYVLVAEKKAGKKPAKRKVARRSTRATAIAPTAGG